MDHTRVGVPQFNGENYALWSKKIQTYIQEHIFDVWKSVVDGYKAPTTPPIDNDGKKLVENNSKSNNAIQNGVDESIFRKIIHLESAKEMWDKLKNICEGDEKVKEAKLQIFREKFEQLKMNEDENIASYFL
jgi:hypothetical protein